MITNPLEECPPDEPQAIATLHCVLIPAEHGKPATWSIWCPQWKCHIHNASLTDGVSQITKDIESHNQEF